MYCSSCGKQISEGSKFCNYCGSLQTIIAQPSTSATKVIPPDRMPQISVNAQPNIPVANAVPTANQTQQTAKSQTIVPAIKDISQRKKKLSKGIKALIVFGACLFVIFLVIVSIFAISLKKTDGKLIGNITYLPNSSEFCNIAESIEPNIDVWEHEYDTCNTASAFMDRGNGPDWHLYVYKDSYDAYDSFSYYFSCVETDVYDEVVYGDLYYKDNGDNGYILFNVTCDGNGLFFKTYDYYYGGLFYNGNRFMTVYLISSTPFKKSEMDRIDNILTEYGLPNPRTGSKNVSLFHKIEIFIKIGKEKQSLKDLCQLVNNREQKQLNEKYLYETENSDLYYKVECAIDGNDVYINYYFQPSADLSDKAKVRSNMGVQADDGNLDYRIDAEKDYFNKQFGKRPETITYVFCDYDGSYLFKFGEK